MWSVALSPNGKTIARGSGDYKVRLWDVGTRKDIANWTGHTSAVHALCWSGDSKQAVSGSRDGTARVWDVDSGKTILILKNGYDSVDEVMYSSNSSKLAMGGRYEHTVKIWDAKTVEEFSACRTGRSLSPVQ